MNWKQLAGLIPLVLLACDSGQRSERGFRLPDGAAEAGKTAFVQLGCVKCHTVKGVAFPDLDKDESIAVEIGGKVPGVTSYGQLVTAIINPSYNLAWGCDPREVSKDGKSLMVDANERMTVQQMIDLVAFLQPKYESFRPEDFDPYAPDLTP